MGIGEGEMAVVCGKVIFVGGRTGAFEVCASPITGDIIKPTINKVVVIFILLFLKIN